MTSAAVSRVAVLAVLSAAASAASGATITWGAGQSITGNTDVSTAGSLKYAYNPGTTSTIINGVPFVAVPTVGTAAPSASSGNGDFTVIETQGQHLVGGYYGGSATGTFPTLTTAYQALLGDFVGSGFTESLQVTLGNLTAGQKYQVQVWANDSFSAGTNLSTFTPESLKAVLDGTTQISTNVPNVVGGLGQYSLGTFTADATSQTFLISAAGGSVDLYGNAPVFSGMQLRAVPEPTMLGGLALASLLTRRRRAGR